MTDQDDMDGPPSHHAEWARPEANGVLHDAVAVESRQRRKQVRGRHQPAVARGGPRWVGSGDRGRPAPSGGLLSGGRREAGAGRRRGIVSWAPLREMVFRASVSAPPPPGVTWECWRRRRSGPAASWVPAGERGLDPAGKRKGCLWLDAHTARPGD